MGLASLNPTSTPQSALILASGATIAVAVTISASSHTPSVQNANGSDSRVVCRSFARISTEMNGEVTAIR